ncbi:hypothetical protein EV667_0498 [Ancylobacter aquaticus]|uniref:DUF992 domain-containing protein n=1 Tax=Ancylobacter aquaticus TaxID=100 RepID=A0A4R1I649_ANCAQ|nr:hypothetical protein [Ancylobacter aquaticus]TCK30408.1 hypothetical protein EV667_0498 [Ancylobacter aquaticus]
MSHTPLRHRALLATLSLAALPAAVLFLPGAAPAARAQAGDARFAGLSLAQGDIFTNDVGTVMGVTVANNTAATVGSATVECTFTAKGKPAGSAGTTIYNIVAGATGQDRVNLMGPKADAASCAITAIGAPLN